MLTYWNGFSNLDRLFDDFWSGHQKEESIPFDIDSTEDSIIVTADVPGVKKDDLEIEVNQRVLSIKGRRTIRGKEISLTKSFTLPVSVDSDALQANLTDGVLTLTIPKSQGSKPKKILIGSSS